MATQVQQDRQNRRGYRPRVYIDWGQRGFATSTGYWAPTRGSDRDHSECLQAFVSSIEQNPGSDVFVEVAHMYERTPLSKSQVFTRQQLEQIAAACERNDVRIFILPQSKTTKIRAEAGMPTTKPTDKAHDHDDSRAWQTAVEGGAHPDWILKFKQWSLQTPEDVERNERLAEWSADITKRLNQFDALNWSGDAFAALPDVQRMFELTQQLPDDDVLITALTESGDLAVRLGLSVYTIVFDGDGMLREPMNKHDFASLLKNYQGAYVDRHKRNKIRGVLQAPQMGVLTQMGRSGLLTKGEQQRAIRHLRNLYIDKATGISRPTGRLRNLA